MTQQNKGQSEKETVCARCYWPIQIEVESKECEEAYVKEAIKLDFDDEENPWWKFWK